jgi:hypothetical protein
MHETLIETSTLIETAEALLKGAVSLLEVVQVELPEDDQKFGDVVGACEMALWALEDWREKSKGFGK